MQNKSKQKFQKENEEQFKQQDKIFENQLKSVSGGGDTDSLRFQGKPVPLPKGDPYKH